MMNYNYILKFNFHSISVVVWRALTVIMAVKIFLDFHPKKFQYGGLNVNGVVMM